MRQLDMWWIKTKIRCRKTMAVLQNDDGIGTVEMILILVVIFVKTVILMK